MPITDPEPENPPDEKPDEVPGLERGVAPPLEGGRLLPPPVEMWAKLPLLLWLMLCRECEEWWLTGLVLPELELLEILLAALLA